MYQHIMVPLDGSKLAECVFPHVEALLQGCQVKNITFVRVLEPFRLAAGLAAGDSGFSGAEWQRMAAEEKAAADSYLQQVISQLKYEGVNIRTEVLSGPVAETLADYAEKNNVDLIVIATHGRSGIGRWVWGSVADRVLRSASVPVLMVRATASE